jgi:hypothetical protein
MAKGPDGFSVAKRKTGHFAKWTETVTTQVIRNDTCS